MGKDKKVQCGGCGSEVGLMDSFCGSCGVGLKPINDKADISLINAEIANRKAGIADLQAYGKAVTKLSAQLEKGLYNGDAATYSDLELNNGKKGVTVDLLFEGDGSDDFVNEMKQITKDLKAEKAFKHVKTDTKGNESIVTLQQA